MKIFLESFVQLKYNHYASEQIFHIQFSFFETNHLDSLGFRKEIPHRSQKHLQFD